MIPLRHFVAAMLPIVAAMALEYRSALATEGYFQHGYGARHKALGGAGVSDSRDATAAALNPAGLVHVDDQINVSGSLFSPRRGFVGSGAPGLTPFGDIESGRIYFPIPNFAWSRRLPDNHLADVVALTLYANGGMNTEFPATAGSATCQALLGLPSALGGPIGTGTGVFCNGPAGVNLEQAFLSLAVAKRHGNLSFGVAPIIARQAIEFEGLQLFQPFSISPAHVSNRGVDVSYGVGVRAGIEIEAAEDVRLGIAANSRILMSNFNKYRGLLANGGDFDIPPSLQAGIAVDLTSQLTLMLDYKRIWYSTIESLNNSSANLLTASASPSNLLGGSDGPGFGWQDIDIIKVGAEWRATQRLTLRAGYAYNEGPFSSRDVTVNILAPGVVQHHFTGGLRYRLSPNWDIELAGFYAPRENVGGPELGIPIPLGTIGNPRHRIDIAGHGGEVTLGLTYRFGTAGPAYK
jgi:long-chain fatty acid transport protein